MFVWYGKGKHEFSREKHLLADDAENEAVGMRGARKSSREEVKKKKVKEVAMESREKKSTSSRERERENGMLVCDMTRKAKRM